MGTHKGSGMMGKYREGRPQAASGLQKWMHGTRGHLHSYRLLPLGLLRGSHKHTLKWHADGAAITDHRTADCIRQKIGRFTAQSMHARLIDQRRGRTEGFEEVRSIGWNARVDGVQVDFHQSTTLVRACLKTYLPL